MDSPLCDTYHNNQVVGGGAARLGGTSVRLDYAGEREAGIGKREVVLHQLKDAIRGDE